MYKANETRMERDYLDRCYPCFCDKEFGRFEANRFYVCDIEYGYGIIAVYRPKGNGYDKVTFDERTFNLYFSLCRDRVTPKTASMITKIAAKFYINLWTRLKISEDGTEYYYILKMSIPQNGVHRLTIDTSGKFYTKEQAYKIGIKKAKKVLTICIIPNTSVREKLLAYFGFKRYDAYFDYDTWEFCSC